MRRFIKYLSLTVGAVALLAAAFAFLGWWLATMPGAFRADTTVILPKHQGTVDKFGNILIYPDGYQAKSKAAASRRAASSKKAPAKGRK